MFLIPLFGVAAGVVMALFLPWEVPVIYKSYTALAILATLDAIFGGMRAQLEGDFLFSRFIVSFFANAVMAVALAYFGNIIGIDLHLGAVVAFSIRLFNNLALIREFVMYKYRRKESD